MEYLFFSRAGGEQSWITIFTSLRNDSRSSDAVTETRSPGSKISILGIRFEAKVRQDMSSRIPIHSFSKQQLCRADISVSKICMMDGLEILQKEGELQGRRKRLRELKYTPFERFQY